jgi:hypothetical protein
MQIDNRMNQRLEDVSGDTRIKDEEKCDNDGETDNQVPDLGIGFAMRCGPMKGEG